MSKYEQVKSNLNVGLFEYALIVGLKPPTGEDDDEIEDDDDFTSSYSKSDTIFSWPESVGTSPFAVVGCYMLIYAVIILCLSNVHITWCIFN